MFVPDRIVSSGSHQSSEVGFQVEIDPSPTPRLAVFFPLSQKLDSLAGLLPRDQELDAHNNHRKTIQQAYPLLT